MAEDNRSRRLGDVGPMRRPRWEWGCAARVPHLLVMFFAEPGGLDALVQRTTGSGWNKAFDVLGFAADQGPRRRSSRSVLPTASASRRIDWAQQRGPRARSTTRNIAALGEFLLGYRNEYDKYTDRPLLDADAASAGLLAAEDAPEKKDLGRNGTYLVIRQLEQDVRVFWQFVVSQSGGDPAAADKLAAAMVGRTRAGDPLVPIQRGGDPWSRTASGADRLNQFTFDRDPRAPAALSARISGAPIRGTSTCPGAPPALHAPQDARLRQG